MLGIESAYGLMVLGIAAVSVIAVLVFTIMGVRQLRAGAKRTTSRAASIVFSTLRNEAAKDGAHKVAEDFLQSMVRTSPYLKHIAGMDAQEPADAEKAAPAADLEELERKRREEDRLEEYHEQGISQSRVAFWFSMIFAALGFAIIAGSLLGTKDVSYVGAVSGTIMEVIAGLFFKQSNTARQLMITLLEKMRQYGNLQDGIVMCELIQDSVLKDAVRVKLSLYLAGLEDKANIAGKIIDLIPKGDVQAAQPAAP